MKRRLVLGALLATATLGARAQQPDREREARLRAEIVPNLVVGEAVDLVAAGDPAPFLGIYTAAAPQAPAVVLVHGSGVHPDWNFIGRLRMDLADRGFATLSIQMPVRPAGAPHEEYAPLMPLAAARIAAAAQWLQGRGHRELALVAHSLGSRMADGYFATQATTPFRAWVSLGITGGSYGPGLSRHERLAVLDVYGERDFDAVLKAAPQRAAALAGRAASRQLRIAGTDHFYAGKEAELLDAIVGFLRR